MYKCLKSVKKKISMNNLFNLKTSLGLVSIFEYLKIDKALLTQIHEIVLNDISKNTLLIILIEIL